MTVTTTMTIAICCFGLAALCGLYRLLAGPDLADRIIALDVILISLMGGITVDAARRDDSTNLVILVVIAIIGFTATVAASRFLEDEHRFLEDEYGAASSGGDGAAV